MEYLKLRSMLLTLVLLFVLLGSFVAVSAQPVTPSLSIWFYAGDAAEFAALPAAIDIVDTPLTAGFIVPPVAGVTYKEYAYEMSWCELSINTQLWPTGWRNYIENPTIELGGELEAYDPDVQRHVDAKHFRTAIAYLTDKDAYITGLGGFGVRTEASKPATFGWISPNLVEWPYSVELAEAELTAGNFQDLDGDGWLEYDVNQNDAWDIGVDEELPPLQFWDRPDDSRRTGPAGLLGGAGGELATIGIPVNFITPTAGLEAFETYLAVMMGAPNAPGVNLPAGWLVPSVYAGIAGWLPFVDNSMPPDGIPDWLPGMKQFHLYPALRVLETPTQDHYYDLYTSEMATESVDLFSLNYGGFYLGDGIEGTADDDWDYEYWASIAKMGIVEGDGVPPALPTEVKDAVFKCQEIAQEFWPSIPWFTVSPIKAYATGWVDVVNMEGYGVDNRWSFIEMSNPGPPPATTINWGFRAEPLTLNRITATKPYEKNVFKRIYDSLLGMAPYEFLVNYGWLAEPMGPGPDGVMGSPANPAAYYDDEWAETEAWLDPDDVPGTGDERMAVTMRLRAGATFHGDADGDSLLDPVTPDDVKFSLLFRRDCGSGVAFEYPSVMHIEYVDTQADDPSLGPRDIKVYFGVSSYYSLYWVGYLDIINTNIWMATSTASGWGYSWPRGSGFIEESWVDAGTLYVRTSTHPGNPCDITVNEDVYIALDPEDPTLNVGPYSVDSKTPDGDTYIFELSSATAPIEAVSVGSRLDEFPGDGTGWNSIGVVLYTPSLTDHDTDGTVDLAEDGAGPWIFGTWTAGTSISLTWFAPGYYMTAATCLSYTIEAFHRVGNVNYLGATYQATYTAVGFPPDMIITMIPDGMYLARSLGTNSWAYPHGTGFMEYNEDCDFDRDGVIWIADYVLRFGMHYGYDGN